MSFYKKLAYYILGLLLLWGAFMLYRSNHVNLKLNNCADSELATLAALDEAVRRNFLYLNYYEVYSYSPFGPCRLVDYDKEEKLLRVCVDPGSGWSGHFKVSETELHQLVIRKAKFDTLHKLCKPYFFNAPRK